MKAETRTCRWLEHEGWTILARNFRGIGFELDIVASKGKSLHIIEVKSRPRIKATEEIYLGQVVTQRQIQRIITGARHFISTREECFENIQIDLIVIFGMKQDKLARYSNIGLDMNFR